MSQHGLSVGLYTFPVFCCTTYARKEANQIGPAFLIVFDTRDVPLFLIGSPRPLT